MAEPEIDEAAAESWAEETVSQLESVRLDFDTLAGCDYNLARAALRWKARAEASVKQETYEALMRRAETYLARAEAAEAERDELRATHERDMCANGHERIRFTPDEDFGPCPVCKLKSERDSLRRQLAQVVKAR